jgi:hypothetical protein
VLDVARGRRIRSLQGDQTADGSLHSGDKPHWGLK